MGAEDNDRLQQITNFGAHHLDFSTLDCESLDVLFVFDFAYAGNHDEVVAEALIPGSPLENLLQISGGKAVFGSLSVGENLRAGAHTYKWQKQRIRDRQSECLGGLEVYDQFDLGRLQNRQIARLRAVQDPAGIDAGLAQLFGDPVRLLMES